MKVCKKTSEARYRLLCSALVRIIYTLGYREVVLRGEAVRLLQVAGYSVSRKVVRACLRRLTNAGILTEAIPDRMALSVWMRRLSEDDGQRMADHMLRHSLKCLTVAGPTGGWAGWPAAEVAQEALKIWTSSTAQTSTS